MAALPKVLAGPILRRCTETMVTVWLATSVDLQPGLELALYDASNVREPKAIDVTTEHQVVQAGANLFVHLIAARPKATSGPKPTPFPRGTLLGYEVMVAADALVPESSPLHSVPLSSLLTTETLDYRSLPGLSYPWPTFFLQAKDTPLRVLHGSCRRAYAPGCDAMAAPDSVIKEHLADVTRRPTLMILTGDQIYADDVLWPMWSHISHMARRIIGYDETAPVDGKLKPLSRIDGRRDLVLKNGLTTDDGENHLIGFSEYSAYYLMSWSETLWDDYTPAFGPTYKPGLQERARDLVRLSEVDRFRQTLPAVRRGLANIPTYMIFDDHDVTDDWNIDKQFEAEIAASPLGTRLITCALYAYWLFQAWGNEPDAFTKEFVAKVQAFCDLLRDKSGSPTTQDMQKHDSFIRSVRPNRGFGSDVSWDYVVPCTPPIFVLDTRTSRGLRARGQAPGLINADGQQALRRTIDRAKRDGTLELSKMPLVMVSATPFWPVQYIVLAQQAKIHAGDSALSRDLEFWRNNVSAHEAFLIDIVQHYKPRSIVFLSGDVHYGFTAHATVHTGSIDPQKDVDDDAHTGTKAVDIYQLTSSAFKNEADKAALSRHWYSNIGSQLFVGPNIVNDWSNYLFDRQTDVLLDGQALMGAVVARQGPNLYSDLQVFLLNWADMRGGPLLVPEYLFHNLSLKISHAPVWREKVHLFDHSGSSGLSITAKAHIGLVTFDNQSLAHELYGVREPGRGVPLARLAPETWGPESIRLRLGAEDRAAAM